MLSQVAERLYWFARYVERTENIARLILVRHQLALDLPKKIQPEWRVITDMLGVGEEFDKQRKAPSEKNVVSFMFGDKENPSSILSSIIQARENMRTSREVLPTEVWERLNSLYLSVIRRAGKEFPRSVRHKILNQIIQSCQQISGALLGTMNHDDSYQFIILGRNLERSDMSTRIIDVGTAQLSGDEDYITPYRNVLWMSILRSLSAYQMYRLNMKTNVSREAVLEFVLQGEVFPRAVGRCLKEIHESTSQLPNNRSVIKAVKDCKQRLDTKELLQFRGEQLHLFIDELQADLGSIHDAIFTTWLHPVRE